MNKLADVAFPSSCCLVCQASSSTSALKLGRSKPFHPLHKTFSLFTPCSQLHSLLSLHVAVHCMCGYTNSPRVLSKLKLQYLYLLSHATGQPSAAAFDYKRFLLATRVYMDKGASTQSGAINTEEGEEGPAGRAGGTRGASTSSIGGGASSSSSGQPAKRQKQHEVGGLFQGVHQRMK